MNYLWLDNQLKIWNKRTQCSRIFLEPRKLYPTRCDGWKFGSCCEWLWALSFRDKVFVWYISQVYFPVLQLDIVSLIELGFVVQLLETKIRVNFGFQLALLFCYPHSKLCSVTVKQFNSDL